MDEDVFSAWLVAGRRYVWTSRVGSLQRVVTSLEGVIHRHDTEPLTPSAAR